MGDAHLPELVLVVVQIAVAKDIAHLFDGICYSEKVFSYFTI